MSTDNTYLVCDQCQSLNRVPFEFPEAKSPICGNCKNKLSLHEGVSDLTDTSLEILIRKCPVPIIIDFWAPWCGPCRAFAPSFIKSAKQFKGRMVSAKLNTQVQQNSGQKFGVKGIPTFIIFCNGKEIRRIAGALAYDDFVQWVMTALREC